MTNYVGWGHRMPAHQLPPPFPYFGGKRNAAAAVWDALGDVGGYVEPFCGSAAVLLGRPSFRGHRVETLNDTDGWLVNAWRAIKNDPIGVAEKAFRPTSEVDLHADAAWLAERRTPDLIAWLEGDPEAYDTKAAARWLYVISTAIGSRPFLGGPWTVVEGRLSRTGRSEHGISRQIPHIAGTPRGILRAQPEDWGETHQQRLNTYMTKLQDRIARVRITVGDWTRPMLPSVLRLTTGPAITGVFLDPPYAIGGSIYAGSIRSGVETEVLDWCIKADPDLRIVLAGYDNDNDLLLAHGWSKQGSIGGQGSGYNTDPKAGRREQLWLSPNCHIAQPDLFGSAL